MALELLADSATTAGDQSERRSTRRTQMAVSGVSEPLSISRAVAYAFFTVGTIVAVLFGTCHDRYVVAAAVAAPNE